MKLSSNFAFPTMLKSVAWLRKIENCNQFSIFVFQPKHSKSLTELPKREGEGSICTVFFFLPLSSPFPIPMLHFSGKEEAGNSYLPHSHFSKHELLQC